MSLSTLQVAMLPTHDPIVGRAVGSMFQLAQMTGKPPVAIVDGWIDGQHPIKITYKQDEHGGVTADGFVGTVQVHEQFDGLFVQDSGSKVFGVAGPGGDGPAARINGTLNDAPEKVTIQLQRGTAETPLTDDLRKSARSDGGWKEKVGLSPTLGGPYVDVNTETERFPTETTPIATTDDTYVNGQAGDTKFGRDLTWKTTTWAVVNSDRQGWAVQSFKMAESASETERFVQGDEKLGTAQPFNFKVTENKVEAHGALLLETPGQAARQIDVDRSYEMIPEKQAVVVKEKFGDTRMEFYIAAGK